MGHKKLPKFNLLKSTYLGPNTAPMTPEQVGKKVGGKVEHNIKDPTQPDYKNTCTIRVSYALNYSADPIVHGLGARTNSGADKKWYVYSVGDFRRYMELRYGSAHVTKKGKAGTISDTDFAGKRGIIIFGRKHADLWDGTACVNHCYFEDVDEVLLWVAED